MHVWKYHNEIPYFVQLIYANKNKIRSQPWWFIPVIPALRRQR
jgi:hypothetical protein